MREIAVMCVKARWPICSGNTRLFPLFIILFALVVLSFMNIQDPLVPFTFAWRYFVRSLRIHRNAHRDERIREDGAKA